ncbi:MAG TPA: carboxypeptidase-like regulatory domain-containing protein [Gemmataceae bacterium]
MRTTPIRLFASLALGLAGAGPALAHEVGAECTLRDGRVEVVAYFDDDTPARSAKVRVLDGRRETLAEGRTDEEGRWSFPAPPAGKYRVVVDAGAGHLAEVGVTVPPAVASPGVPGAAPRVPEEGRTVSDGPTREEFTSFPWREVILGLAVITLGGLILNRLARRPPAGAGSQD